MVLSRVISRINEDLEKRNLDLRIDMINIIDDSKSIIQIYYKISEGLIHCNIDFEFIKFIHEVFRKHGFIVQFLSLIDCEPMVFIAREVKDMAEFEVEKAFTIDSEDMRVLDNLAEKSIEDFNNNNNQ